MKISELRKRSNDFVNNLDNIIESTLSNNEELEQLNKDQLQEGVDSKGARLADYSLNYDYWKRKFYPASYGEGYTNLFLTGEMYKNMELKVTGKQYQIVSMVRHAAKLVDRYGADIFGIMEGTAYPITTRLIAEQYKKLVL
jgi:hypothetical protein